MDAETFKNLHPVEYVKKFTDQQIRPSGRTFAKMRKPGISLRTITNVQGSAMVKFGNTSVVCGIRAEAAIPSVETPSDGFLVVQVELPALASSAFRGRMEGLGMSVSEFLHRTVISCGTLPLDSLCIESGKAVWTLYADLVCVSFDGALWDVCLAALVSALATVRIPTVALTEEGEVRGDSNFLRALSLGPKPYAVTFAQFDGIILADPSAEEESVCATTATVVCTADGRFCGIHKLGGIAIDESTIKSMVELAKPRAQQINEALQKAAP